MGIRISSVATPGSFHSQSSLLHLGALETVKNPRAEMVEDADSFTLNRGILWLALGVG